MPTFPQAFQVTAGPFVGVNDALDLQSQTPERAASITNGYIPSQPGGGAVLSRPGISRAAVGRTYTGFVAVKSFTITGTATFTASSATVTGAGTAFLTELRAGMYLLNAGDATYSLISNIASDTSLTISIAASTNGSCTVAAAASGGGTSAIFINDADAIAVGDNITVNGQDRVVTVRTDSTHFTANSAWTTGGYDTSVAVAVGAATGPLYDPFLYVNTSGTVKRLVFAKTTNTLVAGGGAGLYRFLDGSSVRYRLLEHDVAAATLTFVDRTSASMDGVAIDTSNRLYSISFANYWILSDGTNRMRKVDSSYALSDLTDANFAIYARPTVYYGKLFGILSSDKATLVWSEENDPDTGYTNASYNDSWTLRQTSPDTLEAIEGTNTALYVWRTNSITMITGAVNSDFASAGTQDGLSTTVGTRSPDAVVTVGETVYFLDQYCRPHVIEPGRGVVPLYDNCQTTLGTPPTSASQLRKAWGRLVSSVNGNPIVVWCFPSTEAATTQSTLLAFDAYTREFLGTWTHPSTPDATYGTLWRDTNNAPVLAMCSGQAADLAMYIQRSEANASVHLDDKSDGSQVRVALTVETPKIAPDDKNAVVTDKLWTRCDMGGRDVNASEATLNIETRTSRSSAYGTAMVFTSASVATDFPDKYSVGLNKNGRWWQARVSNDTSTGGRTAIGEFVVEGLVRRTDPHIK
jgi:hypothetical protein